MESQCKYRTRPVATCRIYSRHEWIGKSNSWPECIYSCKCSVDWSWWMEAGSYWATPFDTRSSRESGNGQILYYNEGTGFGYCHCTKCGKTVLESWPAASSSDPDKLPNEMNPIASKDTDKPDYHFALVKKVRNRISAWDVAVLITSSET